MNQSMSVSAWVGFSIMFSVSLILNMKMLSRGLGCKFTTTVTALHFFSTWILLEVMCVQKKIEEPSKVPVKNAIAMSLLLVSSILFMNFNLVMNSIGFYQMSKLCCIPYIVIFTMIFNKQKYSLWELLSLALLLVGVGLFSISDVEINFFGTVVAICGVITSSHSQIMMGSIQHQFDISGAAAQLVAAPYEVILGSIAAVSIEFWGEKSFLTYQFSLKDWVLIGTSCLLAVGVNVCGFGLIGKTSPVTYQVVGHIKTILLLVSGYILFPSNWTSKAQMIKSIVGIIVALIGVISYTFVKLHTPEEEKKGVEVNSKDNQPEA